MPTTFMVFLLSIIQSFQSFREIFLLTGAYPHRSLYMLQHYLNNLFSALDYQRMSAAAYILTLCIIALVLIMLFVQRRVMNYD
jgi:multiple sugar transport system permease protein